MFAANGPHGPFAKTRNRKNEKRTKNPEEDCQIAARDWQGVEKNAII